VLTTEEPREDAWAPGEKENEWVQAEISLRELLLRELLDDDVLQILQARGFVWVEAGYREHEMSETFCPTCGGAVVVHTADEGTSSYEPAAAVRLASLEAALHSIRFEASRVSDVRISPTKILGNIDMIADRALAALASTGSTGEQPSHPHDANAPEWIEYEGSSTGEGT
jgi:hypothetical protein